MQQAIERPLETREEVLEEFARKGRMTRNRGTRIGASKISLIHVAKTQLGMDDEVYRAVLSRVTGVQSSRALDERGVSWLSCGNSNVMDSCAGLFRSSGWPVEKEGPPKHNGGAWRRWRKWLATTASSIRALSRG